MLLSFSYSLRPWRKSRASAPASSDFAIEAAPSASKQVRRVHGLPDRMLMRGDSVSAALVMRRCPSRSMLDLLAPIIADGTFPGIAVSTSRPGIPLGRHPVYPFRL